MKKLNLNEPIEWIPDQIKRSTRKYLSRSGHFKGKYVNYNEEGIKDGYITLMCPYCFSLYRIKTSYKLVSKLEYDPCILEDDYEEVPNIESYIVDLKYYMHKCVNCNAREVELIILDNNIAPSISLLNKKGFYTNFCCEGHLYDNGVIDTSYIYFKNDCIMKYLDHLPKPWELDMSFYHDRNHCIINCRFTDIEKQKQGISDLYEFVKSLPDIATARYYI